MQCLSIILNQVYSCTWNIRLYGISLVLYIDKVGRRVFDVQVSNKFKQNSFTGLVLVADISGRLAPTYVVASVVVTLVVCYRSVISLNLHLQLRARVLFQMLKGLATCLFCIRTFFGRLEK